MSASPETEQAAGSEGAELVALLYRELLHREPAPRELAHWTQMAQGMGALELLRRFTASPAYQRARGVACFWPPGHYYSPVVDPATLGDHLAKARSQLPEDLAGLRLDLPAMERLLAAWAPALNTLEIPHAPAEDRRFHVEGGPFPAGDAASLYLIMAAHRPGRIVEIGSGYSTAAMLDHADSLGLTELSLTCVEPYPDRLRRLMRPGDEARLTLIEKPVQELTAETLVAPLEAGDVLFIDSTHVLKTGSDVHHELFELLPKVRPGVIIHVHDCPYPFEYPDFWVTERNYSWNEAYALRAFLSFNESFEVLFWASMLKLLNPRKTASEVRHFAGNVGSSIWLRRTR